MAIKTVFFTLLAVSIMAAGMTVSAGELDGGALYSNPAKGGCTACHGKDAKSPLMPAYPKLAGQNEAYLLQQMKDIKSGARSNGQTAAMKGIMHLVNEEEMAAMAKYLSGLAP